MAYQRWWKTVRDQQGNAVNGASVAVYEGGTGTLATVYDPNTDDSAPGSLSNPFVTGASGVFGFMAADGEYDVQVSGGALATQQYRVRLSSPKTSDLEAQWQADDAVVAADAAAATALVRADLASTATGKGAALVSFHNGPLNVGDRDGATNSSDPVILASRLVDDTGTGNGHCFSDSSIVTRGGTMAYASYDARFTVTGTQPYNHFAPFQNGMVYGSSGALGYMYGYVDAPSMSNGAVTYRLGIRINDVVKTGGTIGTNAGIWIENLTAGSNNYPIRQVGSNQSWFDGSIKLDGGLVLGTGPAIKPIDSTGVGVSTFTGPITCGGLTLSATVGNSGEIGKSGSSGLRLTAVAGSSYDFSVLSPGNAAFIMTVATGTTGVKFGGTVGFNATNPIAKPTVTGSRGGNAALASLLTALANYGLITDSSTA